MHVQSLVSALLSLAIEKIIPAFICPESIAKGLVGPPKSIIGAALSRPRIPAFSKSGEKFIFKPDDFIENERVQGKYWIEEHVTPNRGKSSDTPLTPEQVIILQRAKPDPHRPNIVRDRHGKAVGNRHLDVRIKVKGRIMSFAMTPTTKRSMFGILPGPGERSLGILQPEHYGPDPPVILSGYGKGVKRVLVKGRCDVWYSSHGNMHMKFEGLAWQRGFGVISMGGDAYMFVPLSPYPIHKGSKTKMKYLQTSKDVEMIESLLRDPNVYGSVKKDGSRVNITLMRDDVRPEYVRVYVGSYRPDKRMWKRWFSSSMVLDDAPRIAYNDKLNFEWRIYDPEYKLLKRGKVNLAGEIWTKSNTGTTPRISPKLQVNDWKARHHNVHPYIYLHTVYNNMTPREKIAYMKLVHEVSKGMFKTIPGSHTEKGKRALRSKAFKEPACDGFVYYDLNTGEYWKEKPRSERDFVIVDIKQEHDAFGAPKDTAIPVIRVNGHNVAVSGSITDVTKRDLLLNPDRYIGSRVVVSSTDETSSGKLFQPIVEDGLKVEAYN